MMAWKQATFEVQTTEGKVPVSGITRRGLGLHLVAPHPDGVRGVWHLVHLRSGLAFLIINMPTAEDASEIAEIIIKYANWRKFETPSAIAAADRQWMPKIIGIKHSLPGHDWIQMLDPAMDDPARIVWYDPKGSRQ
jgi:hypothetical protein